ncbi:sugar phosphate isomerase/epimerase family protein [Amnibacterium flavum]|uniref:Sugar phosphate isomerase/epimerase n=1 Tax=Amnibacterium flavum TaxID=2173173 RepID=A0A2V1HRL4_9MICO|nr:sugar phosphate isomerase/epimerase family protein [Amnibacterium flavum]PVZ95188.1 sugar phosphate isomerase/epimerase [Amnibacterium flavum]
MSPSVPRPVASDHGGPDLAVNPGVWMTGWQPALAESLVERIARIGYRRIVAVLRDPWTYDTSGIRSLVGSHGLRLMTNTNQNAAEDISSDDAEVRDRGLARLRRGVQLSAELESDRLTGILYGVLGKAAGPASRAVFDRTAKILGDLAEEAAESGVGLLVEVVNRYETSLLNTAGQAMDFVAASGSDRLGVHLDVFHMNIEEDDMVAAVAEALPRLGYLELEQNHRGELSRGHIPLAEFVTGAIETGYRGRFGLEAFTVSALAPDHAAGLAVWRDVLDRDTRVAEDAHALLAAAYASVDPG